MTVNNVHRALVAAACALALTACSGAEAPDTAEDSAAVVETPKAEAVAEEPTKEPPTAAPAEVGTRNNPVPIGTSRTIGDWEVSVVSVDLDAADAVAAENQFNDPPAEGHAFVIVGVSAKYVGKESGTFWTDVGGKILGADGNTFSDRCGVIPEDLTDEGETFGGATVTGNLCYSADAAQLEGALLIFEESLSFDDDGRAFFALK